MAVPPITAADLRASGVEFADRWLALLDAGNAAVVVLHHDDPAWADASDDMRLVWIAVCAAAVDHIFRTEGIALALQPLHDGGWAVVREAAAVSDRGGT